MYKLYEVNLRSWSISEARSNIAEVFEAAVRDGPQRINRRGEESVVIVSARAWKAVEAEFGDFADIVLKAQVDEDVLPERRPARVLAGK